MMIMMMARLPLPKSAKILRWTKFSSLSLVSWISFDMSLMYPFGLGLAALRSTLTKQTFTLQRTNPCHLMKIMSIGSTIRKCT
ncbi:hypothetical protein I314_06019 [Cryptococcus bacillisporus CA1873]|uniref:Uncharacterized protein n=2 Tax=Cryptococcus gattii TaxID=552467 RepID=A0A0D0V9Y5_CRYGA|nr:hypothetical protein I312_06394 [Cryptococcus bacillisporus CA1280]KIR58054.1 hypothetical protein I314_06019 [Cryptococcus bacillisporus CA1873]|eukprot:KIR58054.1 hypothetical protein I314_06019 [Cryptococcus gattii CA1873]